MAGWFVFVFMYFFTRLLPPPPLLLLRSFVPHLCGSCLSSRWPHRGAAGCVCTLITSTDESVKYVPIAGFLFLRYLCSSVTAPEGYGIMNGGEVPAHARRGLIRISRAMQSIANGTVPKDDAMTKHLDWYKQWTVKLREFYMRVIESPVRASSFFVFVCFVCFCWRVFVCVCVCVYVCVCVSVCVCTLCVLVCMCRCVVQSYMVGTPYTYYCVVFSSLFVCSPFLMYPHLSLS
jgi:GTPase-activator protein for Ras-like GTPase